MLHVTTRDDSGGRRKTSTFIVTLKIPAVPKHSKIGYLRVAVSVYILNLLCCFNCQQFGHTKSVRKAKTTCATCGQVGQNSLTGSDVETVSPPVSGSLTASVVETVSCSVLEPRGGAE